MPLVNLAVEMWDGSAWDDLSSYVRIARQPVVIDRGFPGSGWLDQVSRTGTCTFTLDNSTLIFSPGGSKCLTGWGLNTTIRVRRTVNYGAGGVTSTRFYGWIDSIQVQAGIARGRNVWVHAVDWIDRAARTTMAECSYAIKGIYANRRPDELLFGFTIGPTYQGLVHLVSASAYATSAETGISRYAVALDDVSGEMYVLEAVARVVASEGGRLFQAADGTLTFHNRHHRLTSAVTATLDNTMRDVSIEYDAGGVANTVRVTTTPRTVSADQTTVLSAITPEVPWVVPVDDGAGNPGSIVIRAEFEDADGAAATGVNLQTPVANTDYRINSRDNGTGYDLSSYCTVATSATINGVTWTITNNTSVTPPPIASGGTGSCLAYVTYLQMRGQLLTRQDSVISTQTNSTSETTHGQRILDMTLPYEVDANVGDGFAQWALHDLKDPAYRISRIAFPAHINDTVLAAADADLEDRIALEEDVSGLTASAPTTGSFEATAFESTAFDVAVTSPWLTVYHITGIRETYPTHRTCHVEWQVAPALTRDDWFIVDDPVYSIADGPGIIGYA